MKDAPVYVKIDKYRESLDILDVIKSKISRARNTLDKIKQLKQQEDEELDLWSKNIEDVERKTDHISQMLFERNE